MNNEEARKQIQQMCAFIEQEANEKVSEIRLKTEQERDKQLALLSVQGRQAINEDFEQKIKDLNVTKRIMKAKASQQELIRMMRERDEMLTQLKSTCHDKLASFASGAQYNELCKKLLVQGMVKLMEDKVKVKCRRADVAAIQKLLPVAAKEYHDLMMAECDLDMNCKLHIDENQFLKDTSAGGVILLGFHNRIVCDNTLDTRLKLAFGDLQPIVRAKLFPSEVSK